MRPCPTSLQAMLLAWFFIFVSACLPPAACWRGRLCAAGRRLHCLCAAQLSPLPSPPPSCGSALSPVPPPSALPQQDTIQKEKELLEQGPPDVSAVIGGATGGQGAAPVGEVGGNPLGPGSAVLLEEAGGNASHLYVDVVGEPAAGQGGGAGGERCSSYLPACHRHAHTHTCC